MLNQSRADLEISKESRFLELDKSPATKVMVFQCAPLRNIADQSLAALLLKLLEQDRFFNIGYAARSMTSTRMAAKGKTIRPASVFCKMPALSSVCTSLCTRFWTIEFIGLFGISHVLVIALARLVVEAQHADPVDNQCQPVLKSVL